MSDPQVLQTLNALRKKRPVTQKHADKWSPPVARLAARINDLRNLGHKIETTMHPNTHNSGRHGRYMLIKEKANV